MTTHGICVPIECNDPNSFAFDAIPFLTWDAAYQHMDNFWPMSYRGEIVQTTDKRAVLLLNEPELTSQADISPLQGAEAVRRHAQLIDGPLYAGGTGWWQYGFDWVVSMLEELGSDASLLTGLHLHCYSLAGQVQSFLKWIPQWKELLDAYDYRIVISEWALWDFADGMQDEVDELCTALETSFRPDAMFYFCLRQPEKYPNISLFDGDNRLTAIGQWWFEMHARHSTTFLPYVMGD